jgi:hypothetical protein
LISNLNSAATGRPALRVWMAAATCSLAALAHGAMPTSAGVKPKGIVASTPVAAPTRLAYLYKAGDVRRYKLTAFFNGHVPQFGQTPVHLMIEMEYVGTVKKVTDKGAVVDFNVEQSKVSLLEDEPVPGAKIDPDKVAELPLGLSQVQKTLNVTATFQPTGVVSDIQGGDASSVKIDLGIDLRKLFLITAPIAFADKPVRIGDTWPFNDGILGSRPGRTTYTGKLDAVTSKGKRILATASQTAESTVDSKLDKEGNSTDDAAAAVGSLVGKVTLNGSMEFTGASGPAAGGISEADGYQTNGKMSMVVNLKRTLPDPDQPGKQKEDIIDIKARLYVVPAESSGKGNAAAKPSTSAPKGPKAKPGHLDKNAKKS